MKKTLLTVLIISGILAGLNAQEYLIVTTVESIVPMGIGRSRMIVQTDSLNVDDYTSFRTDGKASKEQADRKDLKINNMEETMMLNFYSGTGINFQNIASNDALITSKLTQLAREGWKLMFVVGGVESDAGNGDGNGIFITRFILYKE